jgi:hypothetical protein
MPGPRGNQIPVRANAETFDVVGVFDIGAAGAHTKVYGAGMSVARTAAGKYTITFTEWGPVLLDLDVRHWPQADAAPLVPRPSDGGFTKSATTATATYETWDLDTPAQTELPNGDRVTIRATFLKTT